LKHHQANEKMEEFKKNSTSARYFQQRFYYWFDGFMVLKFMHFSRDNHREDEAITVGVSKLLKRMGHALFSDKKLLLLKLRFLEREGINLPN
jgi:IS4 transposase